MIKYSNKVSHKVCTQFLFNLISNETLTKKKNLNYDFYMHRKGKHRHMQLHYQNIKFKIIALNKNVQLRQSRYINSQIHMCEIHFRIYICRIRYIYLFTYIHFNCFIISTLHNLPIKGKLHYLGQTQRLFIRFLTGQNLLNGFSVPSTS